MQNNLPPIILRKHNPFHLVEKRPWPLFSSMGALSLVLSGLTYINMKIGYLPLTVFVILLVASYTWWRDIHRESSTQGNHSKLVVNGLKTGIILFIVSEVFFFVSFFWGFFHRRISPTPDLGQRWPPYGVTPFNPMGVPLLNTILLLSSGVTVTWSHHEILKSNINKAKTALILTVRLGAIFTGCQAFEYIEATFSMSDSAFGSTFFIATGFHGLHVLIGSLFLIVSLARFNKMVISPTHIVGFECAAWYWHFVDVVWLLLYSFFYWWRS